MKVRVREIFASIQGEGPYIGYKQLFIRLCSCNLHCKYCDTEFDIQNSKEYSKEEPEEDENYEDEPEYDDEADEYEEDEDYDDDGEEDS